MDDDEAILSVLNRYFTKVGYQVFTAAPRPVPIPVPFNPQDTVIDREIGPIPADSGADDFGGVGRPRVASEWLRKVRRITLKPFEPKNVFP